MNDIKDSLNSGQKFRAFAKLMEGPIGAEKNVVECWEKPCGPVSWHKARHFITVIFHRPCRERSVCSSVKWWLRLGGWLRLGWLHFGSFELGFLLFGLWGSNTYRFRCRIGLGVTFQNVDDLEKSVLFNSDKNITEKHASFFRVTSWPFDIVDDSWRCESASSSARPPMASWGGAEIFWGVMAPSFRPPWEIPFVCQSFTRPEGLVLGAVSLIRFCGLSTWLVSSY